MNKEKREALARRNIYLVLLALAVVAITVTIVVAVAANAKKKTAIEVNASKSVQSITEQPKSVTEKPNNSKEDKEDDNNSSNKNPVEPINTQIYFELPVKGGKIINSYTAAGVVYNKTLGIYTGHMAIDFSGPENAETVAAYDGEIISITTGYLEGTTVTIKHGDKLKTVYNSIEPVENLKVGDSVVAGQKIGIISTNNRQEYKDGPHLHFEVLENDKKVNPELYLSISEK